MLNVPDYSDEQLVKCVNSELANTLGNLLSRCSACSLNRDQAFPVWLPAVFDDRCDEEDRKMWADLASLPGTVAIPTSLYFTICIFYQVMLISISKSFTYTYIFAVLFSLKIILRTTLEISVLWCALMYNIARMLNLHCFYYDPHTCHLCCSYC